jgi:predicted anti-sigma-YlaC factor YlaD
MTGPACREIRQLLGVYIVGAIDPAERSIVDSHLSSCPACREELSGLAGLPALLGRVPREEVERMGAGAPAIPEMAEPPAELLNSLLGRVSSTRRSRRWRSVLALAAAVAIAAGGAGAIVNAVHPGTFHDTDQGSNAEYAATVAYSSTPWGGMAMLVAVRGVPANAVCDLYAQQGGRWVEVGSWRAAGPSYNQHWYKLQASVDPKTVHGFKITSGSRTLLQIPD